MYFLTLSCLQYYDTSMVPVVQHNGKTLGKNGLQLIIDLRQWMENDKWSKHFSMSLIPKHWKKRKHVSNA